MENCTAFRPHPKESVSGAPPHQNPEVHEALAHNVIVLNTHSLPCAFNQLQIAYNAHHHVNTT